MSDPVARSTGSPQLPRLRRLLAARQCCRNRVPVAPHRPVPARTRLDPPPARPLLQAWIPHTWSIPGVRRRWLLSFRRILIRASIHSDSKSGTVSSPRLSRAVRMSWTLFRPRLSALNIRSRSRTVIRFTRCPSLRRVAIQCKPLGNPHFQFLRELANHLTSPARSYQRFTTSEEREKRSA